MEILFVSIEIATCYNHIQGSSGCILHMYNTLGLKSIQANHFQVFNQL